MANQPGGDTQRNVMSILIRDLRTVTKPNGRTYTIVGNSVYDVEFIPGKCDCDGDGDHASDCSIYQSDFCNLIYRAPVAPRRNKPGRGEKETPYEPILRKCRKAYFKAREFSISDLYSHSRIPGRPGRRPTTETV